MATMQYGKFRGWEMKDIPRSYLIWLCKQKESELDQFQRHCGLTPWWSGAMKSRDEEIKRLKAQVDELQITLRGAVISREFVIDELDRWFRDAAMRFHPDRGGSTEMMRAVNEIHGKLKTLLAD
jgi:putative quorum-sensing-regulated virulence factor